MVDARCICDGATCSLDSVGALPSTLADGADSAERPVSDWENAISAREKWRLARMRMVRIVSVKPFSGDALESVRELAELEELERRKDKARFSVPFRERVVTVASSDARGAASPTDDSSEPNSVGAAAFLAFTDLSVSSKD